MPKGSFRRPVRSVEEREQYSDTEVGITHPHLPGYFKIADNGDIELWASEGLGMVFHPGNRSITIVADTVKFITKEQYGLRWNKMSFNYEADQFQEPSLVPFDTSEVQNIYRDIDDFLEDSNG